MPIIKEFSPKKTNQHRFLDKLMISYIGHEYSGKMRTIFDLSAFQNLISLVIIGSILSEARHVPRVWIESLRDKLCPKSIKCNISMFQVIYPNIGGVCFSFFFLYWKLCQCVCHKNFKSFLKSQFFRSFILMHFQRLLLNNHLLTKVQLITNTHITCPLSLGNNH